LNKDIIEKEKMENSILSAPTIFQNIKNFYSDLPQSSSIKSSVIQTLFEGVERKDVDTILDISKQRVNKAKLVDIKPLNYYLAELGFTRKKAREKILFDWLEEIAPYESGRDKRYFTWTGDIKLMYNKYILHFGKDRSLAYGFKNLLKLSILKELEFTQETSFMIR
jgi:hypothetical protein